MESILIMLALVLTPSVFSQSNNQYVNTCLQMFSPRMAQEGCHEFSTEFEDVSVHSGCRSNTDEEYKCEHSRCMMNATDGLKEDKIDEVKIESKLREMEKRYANESDKVASTNAVRRRCLGGKFEKIWPEETCNPRQYQACVYSSLLVDSKDEEWKDSKYCQEMARNRIQCKTVMDA